MPATTGHRCFEPPARASTKIWRYIDFTKYVSMLDSGGLYFSPADRLGDPFEGSSTHFNVKIRKEEAEYIGLPLESWRDWADYKREIRKWTFVSSWHMNQHESEAMWKIYAQSDAAIAIQSTYYRLHSVLPTEALLGVVKYLDYDAEWMPADNLYWPFVHKRRSFEYERELRAVIQRIPEVNAEQLCKLKHESVGFTIPVDVKQLIEKVFISPTAPGWLFSLVESTTRRFGFDLEITSSKLAMPPEY